MRQCSRRAWESIRTTLAGRAGLSLPLFLGVWGLRSEGSAAMLFSGRAGRPCWGASSVDHSHSSGEQACPLDSF